jgi:hypothetical protein
MKFYANGELPTLKFRIRIVLTFVLSFSLFSSLIPAYSSAKIPSYIWVDKKPRQHENCGLTGLYCVSVKIDPKWVSQCMDNLGDAIHVEVEYFNKRGKIVGYGLDSHRNFTIYRNGKVGKVKEIISYPSTSPYPANSKLIGFASAKVSKVSCLSY